MKIRHLLTIGLALLGLGALITSPSCSEKTRAAAKVLKGKAEDKLIAVAGEGDVALELMKNQYGDLKERLVKIKTLKRTMQRSAEDAEATAKRLDAEGKGSMADRQRKMADRYKTNVEKLAAGEIKAEESLKSFAEEYKQYKMELSILKQEIESTKAMGGIADDLSSDNPLNTRMETVNDLKGKLQKQLDRAESLMEVNELEADL